MDFTNKVIIVTGAASGIGKACAESFAEKGGHVVLVDLSSDVAQAAKECSAGKQQCIGIQGDLTSSEFCHSILAQTMAAFDRLDVLVNCAGIALLKPIMQTSIAEFEKIMKVNVTVAVELSQICAGELKKTKGAIVNLSSVASVSPTKIMSAYCISKAAISHFTRCLALELAPDVRVNAVAPGGIDTPMIHSGGDLSEKILKSMVPHIPLKRLGTAQEIANSVLFLSDPAVSSYVTGTVLLNDGGQAML